MFPTNRGICFSLKANSNLLKTMRVSAAPAPISNLVAHDHYERAPHYRHLNRVTDTCIPEEETMRRIKLIVMEDWYAADRSGQLFPHEFLYKILRKGKLQQFQQIDPKDSWMIVTAEKNALRSRLGGFHTRQYVCRTGNQRQSEKR